MNKIFFFLGPKNHCSRALGSGARERKSFCIILHELVLCDLVKGSQSWKNGVVAWNHMPLLQKNETGFGPDFFIVGENCFGICASGAKDKITVRLQFCT